MEYFLTKLNGDKEKLLRLTSKLKRNRITWKTMHRKQKKSTIN